MKREIGPPPGIAEIEAMARRAFQTIPEVLRLQVDGVPIRVEEFPDAETAAEMGLQSDFDLLGLYRGISLEQAEAGGVREDVDMIFLYRRPILDYWCETEEALEDIVRHVLIHEIGHHFGLSDEDMEAIENAD